MANPTIGRLQSVGIGKQSSRGTQVSPTYWLQKRAFDFNREVTVATDDSSYGSSADSAGVVVVRKATKPSLETLMAVDPQGLLEWSIGETTTSSATSDVSGLVYKHTTKGGTGTPSERYLTIAVNDDNQEGDQCIKDFVPNSLKVDVGMSDYITATIEGAGYAPTSATYTTAFATPQNFIGRDVVVKFATTVSGLTGATAVKGKTMSLTRTVNVNMDENAWTFGDANISDHYKQEYSTEITLDKFLTDQTYIGYMNTGSHYAMSVTISDATTTIGSGTNPSVTYTFPRVSFQAVPGGDNKSLRTEALTLKAHKGTDNTDSTEYMWKSEVVNLVTSY